MPSRDNYRTPDRDVIRLGIRQDEQLRLLKSIEINVSKLKDCMGSHSHSEEDFLDRARESLERSTSKALSNSMKSLKEAFSYLGGIANNWSKASNEYIKISGMRSEEIYKSRAEFTSMIGDLNKSTGYLFNALDSYKNVLSMTQNITGDLDAIQEMSRPLLLASETMPGDLTSIAETFNRFYVRYGFSSKSMESVLDSIRKNTAGNAATPEAVQRAMSELSTNIQMMTLGDEKRTEELMNQVTEFVSYSESLGLDSPQFTKFLNEFLSGTLNDDMLALLANGGLDVDDARARAFRGDLQLTELFDAFLQGTAKVVDDRITIKTDKDGNKYAETIVGFDKSVAPYGLPAEFMKNVWLTQNGMSTPTSLQDFLNKNSSNPSMEDVAEGKYVSLEEKIKNAISPEGATLGTIQDKLGVGFSDVSKILGIIATVVASDKIAGLFSSISGLVRGGAHISGGLFGSLGGAGGLLGSLAGALPWVAGVAAVGYTVYKAYDHYNSLSGNAEAISDSLGELEGNLQEENKKRLSTINELEYNLTQETDLEKQKNLILESGLATREDLEGKTSEQLKALIASYRDAALQMDDITQKLIETADEYYSNKMDIEQSDFTNRLLGVTDASQRKDILQMLALGITDEKTLKKIENFNGSDAAWNDIIYGGKNAWFDDHNLQDIAVSASSMQVVANALGWGMNFTSSAHAEDVAKLASAYLNSLTPDEAKKAWEAIENSKYKEEILSIYGPQLTGIKNLRGYSVGPTGYATGTNYVTRDQIALIHEGEEITPKKYNFAASGAGILKEVLDNMRESTDRQSERYSQDTQDLIEELRDIKEFIKLWKSSQDIDSIRSRGRSPIAGYSIAR